MPSSQNHIKQAKANLHTLELLPTDLYTWRVTLRFYAILHLLDAVFDVVDHHPNNHDDRAQLLRQKRYGMSYLSQQTYRKLEQWSREARYDCPSLGRLEYLEQCSKEDFEELFELLGQRLGFAS